MNMRIYKILIILLTIIFFNGCTFKKNKNQYSGEYPELYSVAINSLLGARGDVEERFDSQIEIIEEDQYGRKLFLYYESTIVNISVYSLIISQGNDNKYSYFYPDYNFISAKTKNGFSEEDIEGLKKINDWNKEKDNGKCVEVEIVRSKGEGTVRKNILTELYKKALGEDAENKYPSIEFLTSDDYGRSIYLGSGKSIDNRRYVVMLFESNCTYDESKCYMDLPNLYDYQDELKAFKELNNWNHPLEGTP